jgi:hypothetical protein
MQDTDISGNDAVVVGVACAVDVVQVQLPLCELHSVSCVHGTDFGSL